MFRILSFAKTMNNATAVMIDGTIIGAMKFASIRALPEKPRAPTHRRPAFPK